MAEEQTGSGIDLSLATTDELWEELSSRFEACVFAWLKKYKDATDPDLLRGCDFEGGQMTCLGLARFADVTLAAGMVRDMRLCAGEELEDDEDDDT